MIRRTQTQWLALFTEHQASGLKAIEFCKQHNICPNYFSKRKTELLSSEKVSTQSSAFVTVTPTTHHETTTLSIHHEQTILTIPMSVSPNWLADFIQQLQA